MSDSNLRFKIITTLTFSNYIKVISISLSMPIILLSLIIVVLSIWQNTGFIEIIPIILFFILIIPIVSLYKVYKFKQQKIKAVVSTFTPKELIIEAPNSKVSINKNIIKNIKFYKGFIILRTIYGKQPILVTSNQAKELREFLSKNNYKI